MKKEKDFKLKEKKHDDYCRKKSEEYKEWSEIFKKKYEKCKKKSEEFKEYYEKYKEKAKICRCKK